MLGDTRRNKAGPSLPYNGVRVGEASNPGPSGVDLRDLATAAARLRDSLRNFDSAKYRRATSGAHGGLAQKKDPYAIAVTTANTTCWNSGKEHLGRASAQVVLIQRTSWLLRKS